MECKVDTLMKDVISLMGSSEGIFRLTTNEMCQPPTEPSLQEEFEHIVMNFIYDQEERIKQLKNYMQDITDEFMEFSLEVVLSVKERIKENESKPRKIKKITKYPDTKVLENSSKHNFSENLEKKMFPTPASHLCAMSKRARSTKGHASSSHNETIEEKVCKFRLNSSPTRVLHGHSLTPSTPTLSPDHNGLTFSKSTSLFSASLLANSLPSLMPPLIDMTLYTRASSLGWEEWKGKFTFLSLDGELVYTPRGSPERYNVRNTKVKSIRNPRIRLAYSCLTMTITGRKETTHRVTKIDLFYLYCIFRDGIVCNIPYWLTKYLKSIREKSVIFRGMFVIRMARSFSLLTNELVREGGGDDEEGDGEGGNEGIRFSADNYHNMSQGTDKAKITRKWSKPDKHGHGNKRAHKEPEVFYKKVKKSAVVNPQSTLGQSHNKTKIPKLPNSPS
ncbi:hypothetical protein Tco_0654845 [Tanacetum coccineum]|uniref:Uncharacterized protein n=1 Tax=Tanacetum coccineum TaxID=301880 RepID=A0ABQ4X5F8_9ASTR